MIETIFELTRNNLLSPVILFFILGFGAKLLKSDLEIPGNVSKFIAIYLMMAIGFKGGYSLSQNSIDASVLLLLLGGALFSFVMPFIGFALLGLMNKDMRATEKAAIAAHYGSISVVTFVTATELLRSMNVTYDSWMVAVMAIMETPAIIACLILVNTKAKNAANKVKMNKDVWHEILMNGAVVVLVGSFFIGWMSGEDGMETVKPFFVDIFKGVLCLFMIDIGMVAAAKLGQNNTSISKSMVVFGIIMPLIGATGGSIYAAVTGLSLGSAMLFATLCASASYIAVPAALRVAMPQVNLSPALTLSLAITFPFNIIFGLPLYYTVAKMMVGG